MSRLLVEELQTTLYQQITVGNRNMMVGAIRPHLLVFNKTGLGVGTLKLQLQDASGRKVADSETLNISAMSTLDYAHKYYRFLIDVALKANTIYRVALIPGGGYAFDESAYIGWCNGWESRNNASYSPSRTTAPLDMEIWAYRELRRGVA